MKNGILVATTLKNGTQNGRKNIGDYIQSLAGETFFDTVDEYIDREKLASYRSNSGKTRVIMNAWYIWFPDNWPPSEDIVPYLISMHISPLAAVKMLSSEGIDYLKKHGPVGCRDTGTEALLQQYTIPCYFSGCLTLTLGEKYKTLHRKNHVLFVDPYFEYIRNSKMRLSMMILLKSLCYGVIHIGKIRKLCKIFYHSNFYHSRFGGRLTKLRKFLSAASFYKTYSTWFDDDILYNAEYIAHMVEIGDGTPLNTEKEKIEYARNLVKKYAEAALVITSRIHCALPCLGLETPILFVTSKKLESENFLADSNRFGGLTNLFRVMRYNNFSLSTNDATIKAKINRNTKISNKNDYIPIKNELLRRCYEFTSNTPPPPNHIKLHGEKQSGSKSAPKKGKVGIISINKYSFYMNYGAALHSFAFQKYLDKRGVDNVIIDYLPKHISSYRLDFPIISALKNRSGLKHIIGCSLQLISAKIKYDKFMRFFSKNYRMVNCSGRSFTEEYFTKNKIIDVFDFEKIVCESDVIWSPKTNIGFDRAFFCDYEFSKFMIKIAYAASISNTFLKEDEEKKFVYLLKNFDYISTREKQTAEYVQSLTDKKVHHVLDPVLLLEAEDYRPYIKETKKRNYLLVYNCMRNDRVMMKRGKEFAKTMGWELIEISNYNWNRIHNKVYSSLGIEEFLGYFLNAQFIITNGFHGMCFSLIFKKNFYVFERDGIDLKLRSLLSTLDLYHCFITGDKKEKELVNNIINYNIVYEKLDDERRRSISFIDDAIINSPPPPSTKL